MADQLYLSLWFPDFRLDALPSRLQSVMRQFALISGEKRVAAAATYPISFSEPASFQRVYINDQRSEDTADSIIENAVAEATEQLHDDTAYEFEMRWKLWTPDSGFEADAAIDRSARLDTLWRLQPATVKIIGFGPAFDDATFEQNGHIRVDFGLDYPWVLDEDDDAEDDEAEDDTGASDTDKARTDPAEQAAIVPSNVIPFARPSAEPATATISEAALHIQRNVEMLLAFTLSVEKHCGISSRLLWTESGEPLAEKLIARLQRLT